MPNLHWPPSEKWSGEQRQISWSYPQIVVRTSDCKIISYYIASTSLTAVKFCLSIQIFLSGCCADRY